MDRQQTTMGEASKFIGWDVEELNSHLDGLLSDRWGVSTCIDYNIVDGMLMADYEWEDWDDGGE